MQKLRIKNFGAISKGFEENNGFIEFSKATVFLGEQGSGKSTIAKLISTFLWIEKALHRGDFDCSELNVEIFVNKYLAWHSIESYLQEDSEIEFIGFTYSFLFQNKKFIVRKLDNSIFYQRPKISYISSERNFCSSIPRAEMISGLLHNLSLTIEDFQNASEYIKATDLPIGNFSYRYDKNTKRKFISNKNHQEIQLYEAASGIQSLTPLYLITKYYSDVSLQFLDTDIALLSVEQKKQIRKIVDDWLKKYDTNIKTKSNFTFQILKMAGILNVELENKESTNASVLELENNIFGIVNSCFINIVEEPEQNLYPNSQKAIMEFLFHSLQHQGNRLIFTTHSPYVLGTVNNCLYAGNLMHKKLDVTSIIDKEKCLKPEELRAYFIENGKIVSAFDEELGQINHDLIDGCSREINEIYEKLSDVEFNNENQ